MNKRQLLGTGACLLLVALSFTFDWIVAPHLSDFDSTLLFYGYAVIWLVAGVVILGVILIKRTKKQKEQ